MTDKLKQLQAENKRLQQVLYDVDTIINLEIGSISPDYRTLRDILFEVKDYVQQALNKEEEGEAK
jgi:hypothetical protein